MRTIWKANQRLLSKHTERLRLSNRDRCILVSWYLFARTRHRTKDTIRHLKTSWARPIYKISRHDEGSHQHLRNGMILFETFLVYGLTTTKALASDIFDNWRTRLGTAKITRYCVFCGQAFCSNHEVEATVVWEHTHRPTKTYRHRQIESDSYGTRPLIARLSSF